MFRSYRPVLGVPFNYDESWIGGTYYVKNLIGNLGRLPDAEQPEIWLLSHGEDSFEFIRSTTRYPHLHWRRPAMIAGIDGGMLTRRARLFKLVTPAFLRRELHLDMIYPFPIDKQLRQTVCWIPDFQDKHLPQFFTPEELAAREQQHRYYFENFEHIIFSSEAARSDFQRFYPEARVRQHVVHFAVHEALPDATDPALVLERHRLPPKYFYCPNQFWAHKNHDVVIRATELLAARGVRVTVAFSGREHDYRIAGYTEGLKQRVASAGLQEQVRFLGFIPREDQITIFRHATSIIQPSLFEGWSTVIEDARSVSQYVLASRIPANLEQADANIEYFDPDDAETLAQRMESLWRQPPVCQPIDYRIHQFAFARDFMAVMREVMQGTPRVQEAGQ